MRLPAVAAGALLALVVAILLAVSFAVEDPAVGGSGPSGGIGTTSTHQARNAEENP